MSRKNRERTDPLPPGSDSTSPGRFPPLGTSPPLEVPDPERLPLPPEVNPWVLEVSDLKQYAYCPRVVYYRYRLPDFRPETYKMEAGREAHVRVRERLRRRLPRAFPVGEVRWEVAVVDIELRLSGRIDLLIASEAEIVVVDFKNARRVRANWKEQLAAYGLLAERRFGKPVREGYIYLIPLRRLERVPLTERRKARVAAQVARIVEEIQSERQPPPTSQRGRCVDCEYRRFCNDLF